MLRLLHTADWHLGRRFPSFPEEGQKKLSRARMDVVGRILDVARRNAVNAVLCVGDIFDDPDPSPDFWEGLARTFQGRGSQHPPLFLVPGNHDPLTPESVWAPDFRLCSLTVLHRDQYSTMVDLPCESEVCALSLDFNQRQLEQILSRASPELVAFLRKEISRDPSSPRTIDFEGEVAFAVRARLGQPQVVQRETFVPLVAQEIL